METTNSTNGQSLYKCEKCESVVGQVYGENVDGKYMFICSGCLYPKRKR